MSLVGRFAPVAAVETISVSLQVPTGVFPTGLNGALTRSPRAETVSSALLEPPQIAEPFVGSDRLTVHGGVLGDPLRECIVETQTLGAEQRVDVPEFMAQHVTQPLRSNRRIVDHHGVGVTPTRAANPTTSARSSGPYQRCHSEGPAR